MIRCLRTVPALNKDFLLKRGCDIKIGKWRERLACMCLLQFVSVLNMPNVSHGKWGISSFLRHLKYFKSQYQMSNEVSLTY